MKVKKVFLFLVAAGIIAAVSSLSTYYFFLPDEPEGGKLFAIKGNTEDEQMAINTLNQFFGYLHSKQYDQAMKIFSPSDRNWEMIESMSLENEKKSPSQIMKKYCDSVRTCFRSEVLEVEEVEKNKYMLTVRFIQDDGEIFVLGPCCAATVEDMPPTKRFKYFVNKVNGQFKVITIPQFIP